MKKRKPPSKRPEKLVDWLLARVSTDEAKILIDQPEYPGIARAYDEGKRVILIYKKGTGKRTISLGVYGKKPKQ